MNNLNNVKIEYVALSDSEGSEEFLFDDEESTKGKIKGVEPKYKSKSKNTIEADSETLDNLVDEGYPIPDILKIDVEGGAGKVLRGGKKLLRKFSPRIYIELHGPEEQNVVKEEILEKDYVVENIGGKVINDPTEKWESPLWCYKNER